MKKFILTLTISLCFLLSASAQHQLDTLILNGSNADKSKLITDSAYKVYLHNKFNTISGTQVKGGKVLGTSATIDDKSVTVNFSIKPIAHVFYLQPTIAATSSNGFASIFDDNAFTKTLTGGTNFQLFLAHNFSNFDPSKTYVLHNQLRVLRVEYLQNDLQQNRDYFHKIIQIIIDILSKACDTTGKYKNPEKLTELILKYDSKSIVLDGDTSNHTVISDYKNYMKLTDTLIKLNLTTPDFHKQSIHEQLKFYNKLEVKSVDQN